MNNNSNISDSEYIKDTSSSSTTSSEEIDVDNVEEIPTYISKEADKSIDKKYTTETVNTATDDIKTYGLRKPKRIIITGIVKND